MEVDGVDSFTDYYAPTQKRRNAAALDQAQGFRLIEQDLRSADPKQLLAEVDVVFHQAAQPGVRSSWASGFAEYLDQNVLVTQRLLEAAHAAGSLTRFVYASSSSVYGNAASYPTRESDRLAPHSPYGVTKLAGENLVGLYGRNFGVPTFSLRYHTVYGPRQRPDMATHRLFESALTGQPFPLYGAGQHVRDFTFVGDVARANLLAAQSRCEGGSVVNIAGGGSTTMAELVAMVEELTGRTVRLDHLPAQPGDVQRTGGSSEAARRLIGWQPSTSLRDGLAAQLRWHESIRSAV